METTKIKHNTLFFFDKVKDSPEGLLRVRVRWEKNKVTFSLGYRVDMSKCQPIPSDVSMELHTAKRK